MTYLEWRKNIYTPLKLCAKNLTKGTGYLLMPKMMSKTINWNVAHCVTEYGYDTCAAVIAHTMRLRRYSRFPFPSNLLKWADSISSIEQYEGNEKRNFWELSLKCNDKTLVAIAESLIFYKKEVLAYAE